MPVLILHYHEIWLKGCNRNFFIQKLKIAVRQALEGLEAEKPVNEEHRIRIRVPSDDAAAEAIERLKKLPGIAYMALATETEPVLGAIIETGSRLMADANFRTYRVRARRSQKSIPFRSIEVARRLGRRIGLDAEAAGHQVKVDLENAEATCYVEVTPSRALLYRDKIRGIGGLPTGSAGKLACLLSGGFDSGRCRLQDHQTRRAADVRALPRPARPRRRGQPAHRSRTRKSFDTLSGPLASIPRALWRNPAGSRRFGARELPHSALPAADAADRRADRLP